MTRPHADQAATTTPEKGEAGHRANGASLLDQGTHPDSAALVERDQEKGFSNLRANLALHGGYCLNRTEATDGPRLYYVGRHGIAHELRDLDAVRAFAQRVGVNA